MSNNTLRIPKLLDVATYISIAAMSLLGISGLPSLNLQLVALGLCLLFGIFYHFLFGTERYLQNPNLYFGIQTFVLTLIFLLGSSSTDAFNFLFLLLAIHTAVALPARHAGIWIAIYYLIVSAIVLSTRGLGGVYAILFYLIAYVACGSFGHTLQQAELERDRNMQLVEILQATQQKLQELAIVEERNRLARDLHDSVKQQVFAISMQLSAARISMPESDKAYGPVILAERLAQQAGAELTTLINELRPPGLERKSLSIAILEHVNEWSHQNGFEAEINIDENISVNTQVEQTLFRVLQEALANVARHSKASKVKISLRAEFDAVSLTIEDNGIGFDAEGISRGVGLDSMKERLIAVNGELEISGQKSKGTRIIARVRSS
jgi:signal transduction histidine kinase